MSKLLRYYSPGNVYFVTSVTHDREKILTTHPSLFRAAIEQVRATEPFELVAHVILPDHVHLIIDPGSSDLSHLMKRIKLVFAYRFRQVHSLFRHKTWQRRFWDHIIRDEDDMNRHIDYVHYNPVRHGLVLSPFDWPESSIHEYRDRGIYADDWGVSDEVSKTGTFGE
ncbi:MAG: transposase [candidate division Zixibacteria bacterium]|nr:transposase [candidate division Zixibacteria bacterium]